jgi:hypothetical protein
MKKGLIILIIVILIIALPIMWGIKRYNRFVTEQQTVKTAWSQVENVYQQRFDNGSQFVNIVKGARDFETGNFGSRYPKPVPRMEVRSRFSGNYHQSAGFCSVPGHAGSA